MDARVSSETGGLQTLGTFTETGGSSQNSPISPDTGGIHRDWGCSERLGEFVTHFKVTLKNVAVTYLLQSKKS